VIPPLVMRLKVQQGSGRGVGLWLPVFLLWIVLVAIVLPLLPLLLIADVILALRRSKVSLTGILWGVWNVLCAMRGLRVEVKGANRRDEVHVICD
jgi:hypothetical protein